MLCPWPVLWNLHKTVIGDASTLLQVLLPSPRPAHLRTDPAPATSGKLNLTIVCVIGCSGVEILQYFLFLGANAVSLETDLVVTSRTNGQLGVEGEQRMERTGRLKRFF